MSQRGEWGRGSAAWPGAARTQPWAGHPPPWAGHPPPWAHGGPPWPVVAAVLLAIQLLGSAAADRHQGGRSLDAGGYVLLGLGPLAWAALRRWWPLVCGVAVGAAAVYLGLGYPRGPVVVSAALALVVAVARGSRWTAWVVASLGYAALLGLGWASEHRVTWPQAVGYAAWLVVVLLVGEGPRYRAEQVAAARRARAGEGRAAASAERLALARDLHDTVGHSLSMIAVQAGVALHLLDEHPEQARPALTAIRAASTEALDEVRATLAVLRQEAGDVPSSAGAHGLARVGELVEAARLGGLDVRVDADPLRGNDFGLPTAVDAAAYRVVQEALTNVARHANASAATVMLRRSAAGFEVVVEDNGRGGPVGVDGAAPPVVDGGGLRGMRERAAALGGSVAAGPVAGGGFRVVVQFPLDKGPEVAQGRDPQARRLR